MSQDSQPQPGVPAGTVTKHTLAPGKFFPGTPHNYQIYVPAQYDPSRPIYTHPRFLPGARLGDCVARDAIIADTLGGNAHSLRHSEVDRELDNLEVVVLTANLARDGYELLEAQMIARVGRHPEPVPGRAAVTTNDPTPDLLLQR